MKLVLAAVSMLCLAAASAQAQTVPLHQGQTVTLRFENDRAIVEDTTSAGPMTKYEAYVIWRAENVNAPQGAATVPPQFIAQGEGPPHPPTPTDERLHVTMRQVPGLRSGSPNNTVIFIANGYKSNFAYRALMTVKGQSAPTDVCSVPPNFLGLEHWPYVIEEFVLSDLRLERPDGAVRCE